MSLITTPPPSRRPIKTHLAPYDPETVRSATARIGGGQVFMWCREWRELRLRLPCEMVPGGRLAHGQMDESS